MAIGIPFGEKDGSLEMKNGWFRLEIFRFVRY